MPRAMCKTHCLRDKFRLRESLVRAAMAKEAFAEEEGLKLNLENSRNEAQNHGENCAIHRVNSNTNYGL